MTNKALLR